MAEYSFQSLAQKGSSGAKTPSSMQATKWFGDVAKSINNVNISKLQKSEPGRLVDNITSSSIGRMYSFFYDPKLKHTLPYYDRYPLVFPIELYSDGFLGINMHYLPPFLRAKLMDALYTTINNTKFDDTTKIVVSYNILNGASRFKYFKPCIKRYLHSHVKSKYMDISPTHWDMALMLPTERFVGADAGTVQGESADKISRK